MGTDTTTTTLTVFSARLCERLLYAKEKTTSWEELVRKGRCREMKSFKTAQEVADFINNKNAGYVQETGFGLRNDRDGYSDGDKFPCSRVWIDGDPTDELLDGTSTIGINYGLPYVDVSDVTFAANRMWQYCGDVTYLVGTTKSREEGNDPYEVVMPDAICFGRIDF